MHRQVADVIFAYNRQWNEAVQAMRTLTDAQVRWRPAPDANSIGMIVRHTAWVEEKLLPARLNGTPQDRSGVAPAFREDDTVEGLVAVWTHSAETMKAEMAKLTDADLSVPIEFRPGEVWTKGQYITYNMSHSARHAGQIVTQARQAAKQK